MKSSSSNISDKVYLYTFLFLITAIRLVYIQQINISPDEAYYWNWSRHLDLSYYDHPPMTAYIIYLTTLFNTVNTEFSVRVGAVLMVTGMSYLLFLLARDVFQSDRAGLWAAIWANLSLIFSLGGLIITPDTPQAFFSLLFIFCLYKAVYTPFRYWYYISGFFLGCALLSKYTSFLFFPAFFLYFLLSKENRHLLTEKTIYITLLIAIAVFSPVIIWNINHNWISFSFQLSHGFGGDFRDIIKNMPEFVGTQVLLLSPFLFFLVLIAGYYSGKEGLSHKNDKMLFFFCGSVPILLFFLLVSMKSKIEGNWPAFAYIPLLVVLGGMTAQKQTINLSGKMLRTFKKLQWISIYSAAIILIAIHLLAAFPPLILLQKTSLSRRLTGWKELGSTVSAIASTMDSEKTFIFGNRHQVISELSFYTDNQVATFQKGGFGRYPYLSDLSFLVGKDALYIAEEGRSEYDYIKQFFSAVEELPSIDITKKGKQVRKFQIYKCINYKGGLINV